MSVNMSQPPKPLKVKRTASTPGVRWRSSEERRDAKRKIDAIRREAERKTLENMRVDGSVFRSPKVLLGILVVLLLLGGGLTTASMKSSSGGVDATDYMLVRARRNVETVALAMTLFRVHTKRWPLQERGLDELARNYRVPGWKGPYINRAKEDPWGTPYVYKMPLSPFQAPVFFSCGPDKKPGTNDDIIAAPEDFACDEGTWRQDPVEEEDTSAALSESTESSPETEETP